MTRDQFIAKYAGGHYGDMPSLRRRLMELTGLVYDLVGGADLADLDTTDKNSLVNAINEVAGEVDTASTDIGTLETLRDTGGMMVYKGTGDTLPASPKTGWVFKVNATSYNVEGAPTGAGDGDFIIYTGEAWELMVDVSFGD